jgi:hypothetical protein
VSDRRWFVFVVNGYGLFGVCVTLRTNEPVGCNRDYEFGISNTISRPKSRVLIMGRIFGG